MRSFYVVITSILLSCCVLTTASAEFPEGLEANGARLVWVDFWASWCAPCRRSFPWMNSMQEKYGAEGFSVIAVNVDKEKALADEFLAEIPARFAVHFDPAGKLAQQFEVQAMPSSFLLDGEGKVIARHYGFRLADTAEYEAKIRDALDSAIAR